MDVELSSSNGEHPTSDSQHISSNGSDSSNYENPIFQGQHFNPHLPPINFLACSILLVLIGLVALVGNSLMLRAWLKYPRLRNDLYTVFAAISFIDIIFVLTFVPITVTEFYPNTITLYTGVTSCKIQRYVVAACGYTTAALLVILTTLRAILLTNRNTFPRPRGKYLAIISVICFIVIFLVSIPVTSMYSLYEGWDCYYQANVGKSELMIIHSFSTFVPLLLIAILYFIAYLLGKRFFADSYSPRETLKFRLINAVVAAFFCTQVPYTTVKMYDLSIDHTADPVLSERIMLLSDYLKCLALVDKAIRPILCSKLTKDLGRVFDEIINCQGCEKNKNENRDQPQLVVGMSSHDIEQDGGFYVEDYSASAEDAYADEMEGREQPSPLTHYSTNSRIGVDRSISTSSTASTNSQAPLIRNHSHSSESEMNINSTV